MIRSQINPMPEYFDRYINMTDDVDLATAFKISLHELDNAPIEKWKALGNKTYAPGKWTVKDILQHLTDTERVFSYRALSFARGEKTVTSFDEENYGRQANANNRTLEDLLEEALIVRKSTMKLYETFTTEMLKKVGIGFKGEYSVLAIGFIFPGHQRWHFKVIEDKYYPLLNE
ncbi:MAG TPA: DinB family protein [Bacteroidia bacterium]|nr:DinB family protein [Bacteroidia bacterium]HNU34269.1 DinB family protein [Bacteroidia bacterium]